MNAVPMMESGLAAPAAGKDSDSRGGNELDRARVDCEERAHGVSLRRRAAGLASRGPCMARSPSGCRSVGQAKHVGCHVHHHRAHRRMVGPERLEQPAHDRPQGACEEVNETRHFSAKRIHAKAHTRP